MFLFRFFLFNFFFQFRNKFNLFFKYTSRKTFSMLFFLFFFKLSFFFFLFFKPFWIGCSNFINHFFV
ncbi:hypothetical protein FP731_14460 [Vibrio parahaemolyticus]|nr:hypothetical protein [Vibrio parahaemolyticus]